MVLQTYKKKTKRQIMPFPYCHPSQRTITHKHNYNIPTIQMPNTINKTSTGNIVKKHTPAP